MPVLLSLCAALAFGAGDFCGGRAVRRSAALPATFTSLATGLLLLLLLAPWTAPAWPSAHTLGWGVFAGVTGSLAALTLYPALAMGSASEVAPLSAVIGTAGPVLFGILGGERPSASAWAGIALACATIVLVSAEGRGLAVERARRRRALSLAALSGVCIAAFLIAFERAGTGQGLLPLLVARATAVPLFGLALLVRRERFWPRGVSPAPALAAGAFDIGANGCYLSALAVAPLSITATLANLYPVATVVLGVVFLGDRPRPIQRFGLVLALGAIVLITR